MEIIVLDCQNSLRNYAFIIVDNNHNGETKECVLIDTLNSHVLFDYLEQNHLTPTAILCTHHHNDHVGGNLYLQEKYNCRIYGHYHDRHRIIGVTDTVIAGDVIALFGNQLQFKVMPLDGHTIGHIGFYEANKNWLFVGDTLFNMGCGRRFEGSSQQYQQSLETIKNFPDETIIYATHEYTLDNIAFAKHIIPPAYEYYAEFLEYCDAQAEKRTQNTPTIPFDLSSQKKFNPFLLCHLPIMQNALAMNTQTPAEVFGALRLLKDNFHPPTMDKNLL